MSTYNAKPDQEKLQLEIAILQKKILAFKPCYARIIIPALMGNDPDNYISLPMPLHLSVTYGDIVIPEGTKLLVQAVSANHNDMKIVGFYDEPKSINFINFISRYIYGGEDTLPKDYDYFPYDEI